MSFGCLKGMCFGCLKGVFHGDDRTCVIKNMLWVFKLASQSDVSFKHPHHVLCWEIMRGFAFLFVWISECVSELFWCLSSGNIFFLCFKGASHFSFKHAERIGGFLAEKCFVCSKGESRDVSFEHTNHAH